MSSDGGAPYRPDEPTSFELQPPWRPAHVPHPDNPYATPSPAAPRQAAAAQPSAAPTPAPTPAAPSPGPSPSSAPPTRSAAPEAPPQDPGAGRLIAGRYRLLAKLGHGGMGTVWRAEDETVDREVAVKEPRVPDHLSDRERANAFERMRREARAAARLDHPAVVNVHDVAVVDGRPWIVMELVRGRSLGAALQEGTLGTREAARIGLEVLGALEAAHAAGILHRDVKPDNVLLGRHDRVVLTDFGIAQIEGETNLTDTGGFVGSPEYVAPERVLGQRPGPASDLWSLGVVLYAATEGVSPFRRSNTPATLQSVLNAAPSPPAASGPLADAVNGLLQKDPARRPNAAQTRALLEQAADPPAPAATQALRRPESVRRGVVLGPRTLLGIGAAAVAAALTAYLVTADPFAGPLPDGWKANEEKALDATLAAPAGYRRTVPEDPSDGNLVTYTDPSGVIWIALSLARKSEDTGNDIAGSAAAEMYDDESGFRQSGSYPAKMPANPRTEPRETTYQGRKSAEDTVTYTTDDKQNPLPRQLRIFYYKTSAGNMYKLSVGYPGQGDFAQRGRDVAATAIANLEIGTL
ncbi:serine/threonine protein kinase [Streptomyces zinciresistens K42]|uniref:non-specific serine/threonine protein kinase n=1 Tax=Streptomyces zinciresistens K42 TaxID=700597 RepID=G2GJC7_9ACTN|nr:serine/threonine-protein kinase [Streptomyces zinciresistens]EGX56392.1 serine/threonine protein kinase [Streptomyces zinciresistens K42]